MSGPGSFGWDISTAKSFRIREGHSLQFRWDAFNVVNRPNLGARMPTWSLRPSDGFKARAVAA